MALGGRTGGRHTDVVIRVCLYEVRLYFNLIIHVCLAVEIWTAWNIDAFRGS